MLDESPPYRRACQSRDTDPEEDKRNSHPPLLVAIAGEVPDGRIIQPLHRTREETVEAGDDDDGGVAGGGDPDQEEDGRQEDGRDDGIDGAKEAV